MNWTIRAGGLLALGMATRRTLTHGEGNMTIKAGWLLAFTHKTLRIPGHGGWTALRRRKGDSMSGITKELLHRIESLEKEVTELKLWREFHTRGRGVVELMEFYAWKQKRQELMNEVEKE